MLLSVFSKLLEKLVYNRLIAFIEGNGVLTDTHGFRTKNQLKQHYRFLSNVHRRPLGGGTPITKVYDVLNHKVLLSKLNSYCIRGVANLWFESYLPHRKKCVEINSKKKVIYVSTTKEIEHGVPQGSILGPILFSLYINGLPLNIMGSKIVLFEDDTNILLPDENISNLQYKLTML